jgi:hypothetical protein
LKKVIWLTDIMGLRTYKKTFGNMKVVERTIFIGKTNVFVCGKANNTRWFKLFGKGLSMTDQPLFSIRNGYRKTLKFGRYHLYVI